MKTILARILLFLFSSGFVYAQENDQIPPLFASVEPLKFTIMMDSRALKKDNSDIPEYSEGQLILYEDNVEQLFDIKVRARGISRRIHNFCSFPPIKLNFKKKAVTGTVFEGQDKLKLVAYCKDFDINEAYVLKEYLVYKLYNYLTPYSFKVRLAQITYKDIQEKDKEVTRYGFLIEDNDIMAKRNKGKISEVNMSHQDRCERNTLDLFTIFQYMIGNTDWSISKQHNVKLIALENGTIIPVPYDFDYCGLVDAKYAVPSEELGLGDVRERLFRGYCRISGTYEKKVEIFNAHKEEMYDEIYGLDLLDEKYKKTIIKYLDEFYKVINDPKLLERKIYDACGLNHTHLHNAKKSK